MKQQEILLVDDNIDLGENILQILVEEGFKVALFSSPKQALEAFVPNCYGLALLDIQMPEMDGIELYRQLKKREPSLNAIAITAYASEEQIKSAFQEGVLVVFSKPINIANLINKIASTLLM